MNDAIPPQVPKTMKSALLFISSQYPSPIHWSEHDTGPVGLVEDIIKILCLHFMST